MTTNQFLENTRNMHWTQNLQVILYGIFLTVLIFVLPVYLIVKLIKYLSK